VLGHIYLASLVLGGGFSLIAVVTGGHFFHHFDIGHLGHHLNVNFKAGHHADEAGLNPLNLRNILAFVAAFGAVGVISTLSATDVILGLILSLAAGLGVAAAAWWFFVKVIEQQSSSQLEDDDLEGIAAQVTLGIPDDGNCGEVRAIVKGQYVTVRAKPHIGGDSFKVGEKVVTMDYKGGMVTVIRSPNAD